MCRSSGQPCDACLCLLGCWVYCSCVVRHSSGTRDIFLQSGNSKACPRFRQRRPEMTITTTNSRSHDSQALAAGCDCSSLRHCEAKIFEGKCAKVAPVLQNTADMVDLRTSLRECGSLNPAAQEFANRRTGATSLERICERWRASTCDTLHWMVHTTSPA